MGRYGEGVHVNELLGKRGMTQSDECTYCERAWSKGFTRCPSCEHDFGDDRDNPSFPAKKPGLEME